LLPVVNSVVLGVPRSSELKLTVVDFAAVMVFSKPSLAVAVTLKVPSVAPVDQGASSSSDVIVVLSAAAAALLAGEVNLLFGSVPATLPHVRAGKMRALASTGPRRLALAPELPTIAESGFPGFDISEWVGLFAPAGTPLHHAISRHVPGTVDVSFT
jgi:hypothetical protein